MAQIYKEQVDANRAPTAPDTSGMEYWAGQRKHFAQNVEIFADQTVRVENQRRMKEQQSLKDLTKKSAIQVYQNASTLYPNDPKQYKQMVAKGLKEVYDSVPDSKMKESIMADVSISGSGYNARVQKKYWDKQENIQNTRITDSIFTQMESGLSNAGLGYSLNDANLTPVQKMENAQAYQDSRAMVYNAYKKRNAYDRNGNPLFTRAQRAKMKDAWVNYGYYGAIDYAQDNMHSNKNSVVQMQNFARNNPKEFKEQYSMTDDAYNKYMKDTDKIISKKTTATDLKSQYGAQVENDANMKEMFDNKGNINKDFNNLNATSLMLKKLEMDEGNGFYRTKSEQKKLEKYKFRVSRAINKQVEENVGVRGERKIWRFDPNVSKVAVNQVNKNLKKLDSYFRLSGASEDDVNVIKAKAYSYVLGELESAGIPMDSRNNPAAEKLAKQLADKAYIEYSKGITNVSIPEKDKNNPAAVMNYTNNAVAKHNNTSASLAIDSRIEQMDAPSTPDDYKIEEVTQ